MTGKDVKKVEKKQDTGKKKERKHEQVLEIKISRKENTEIYLKTCKKWESILASSGEQVNASQRITETFGVKKFYRLPRLLTGNRSYVRVTVEGVSVHVCDDYESCANYIRTRDNALVVNMAFLRTVGISNGVTVYDKSLHSEKEMRIATEAVLKVFKRIFRSYFKPYIYHVVMSTTEFADAEDLEMDKETEAVPSRS